MRMVLFTLCFSFGVWLLQQQAALPDFAWALLLPGFPLTLMIPTRTLGLHLARTVLIAAFACGLGFYHAAWQAEQRLAVSLPDEWQRRDIEVIGVVAELQRSSNPHGSDFEVWALENNVRAVGYVNNKANNVRLAALADGFNYRIETWRETVRDKFNATLGSAPYAGVLLSLIHISEP